MDSNQSEELILEIKRLFAKSKMKIVPIGIVLLLLLIGLTGTFYSIDAEEVGVVQRFGKYIATTTPGLHFKLPFGIDKVTPVKVRRI